MTQDNGMQEVMYELYKLAQEYAVSKDWEVANELDEIAYYNGIDACITDEGVKVEDKIFYYKK